MNRSRSPIRFFLLAAGLLLTPAAGWAQETPPDSSAAQEPAQEGADPVEETGDPNPRVQISVSVEGEDGRITALGSFVIELYEEDAPRHVANFLELTGKRFFDDTTFHRIVPGFIVQGGDPISKSDWLSNVLGTGGPGYTLPAEVGRSHLRGAVAAARKPDSVNPSRESNGSQFFICLADLPALDRGAYTVFGQVVTGMDVVDKVARIKNAGPSNYNRALQRVFMTDVKVVQN